ncbi:MAG TPA: M56 family metallopeptidase [Verrucomicrobiales bacterium]|nr:M56 family metallopeptidase [Verrucomicrobiales bacterium]
MQSILPILMWNTLTATLLAVLVWGITRFIKKPEISYSLWILVMLKLIAPPLWEFQLRDSNFPLLGSVHITVPEPIESESFHASDLPERRTGTMAGTTVMPKELFSIESVKETGNAVIADATATSLVPIGVGSKMSFMDAASVPFPWIGIVIGVWICGSIIWYILAANRLLKFGRLLQDSNPVEEAQQQQVEALAERFGFKRTPRLVLTDGRISPLLWPSRSGPLIVMPRILFNQLSVAERETLIAHECAHYHRRDHWVRWVEFLITGLYWWHPVAWCAQRQLQNAEEDLCDAWVLRAYPDRAKHYAGALLKTLDFLSNDSPRLPETVCGFGSNNHMKQIKQRFTTILSHSNPIPRRSWTQRILLLAFALCVLPLSAAFVQTQPAPEDTRFLLLQENPQTNDVTAQPTEEETAIITPLQEKEQEAALVWISHLDTQDTSIRRFFSTTLPKHSFGRFKFARSAQELRKEAYLGLIKMGPGVVQLLLDEMKGNSLPVRLRIIQIISAIGPDASIAKTRMKSLIKSNDSKERQEAYSCLTQIVTSDQERLKVFYLGLSLLDKLPAHFAFSAFGQHTSNWPFWDQLALPMAELLTHSDQSVIMQALIRLYRMDSNYIKPVIPNLESIMADHSKLDHLSVWAAMKVIERTGVISESTIRELVALLKVRRFQYAALSFQIENGLVDDTTLRYLSQNFHELDPSSQTLAFRYFERIGIPTETYVPFLIDSLREPDDRLQQPVYEIEVSESGYSYGIGSVIIEKKLTEIIDIIGQMDLPPPNAVPEILSALEKRPTLYNVTIYRALARLGWNGEELALKMLDDVRAHPLIKNDEYVEALVLCSEEAIPILLQALSERPARVRRFAAEVLARLKLHPDKVIPVLNDLLKEYKYAHFQQTLKELIKLYRD